MGMFVDIDTKKPVMFSSPYGGCATYGNWSTPEELWSEWTENPSRDRCFDVTSNPNCVPYVQPKALSSVLVWARGQVLKNIRQLQGTQWSGIRLHVRPC